MLRKDGLHGHPVGGGPPKPLCRNFGQLPKLTGDWVDHPEPNYQGMYSQVTTLQMLSHLSIFTCRCMRSRGTKALLPAKQALAGFVLRLGSGMWYTL